MNPIPLNLIVNSFIVGAIDLRSSIPNQQYIHLKRLILNETTPISVSHAIGGLEQNPYSAGWKAVLREELSRVVVQNDVIERAARQILQARTEDLMFAGLSISRG
jgi:hypothetical protein